MADLQRVRWDETLKGLHEALSKNLVEFKVSQGVWSQIPQNTHHVYLEYHKEKIGVGDEAQAIRELHFFVDLFWSEKLSVRHDTRPDERDKSGYTNLAKHQQIIENTIKEYCAASKIIFDYHLDEWTGDGGVFVPVYASRLTARISYFETLSCYN